MEAPQQGLHVVVRVPNQGYVTLKDTESTNVGLGKRAGGATRRRG